MRIGITLLDKPAVAPDRNAGPPRTAQEPVPLIGDNISACNAENFINAGDAGQNLMPATHAQRIHAVSQSVIANLTSACAVDAQFPNRCVIDQKLKNSDSARVAGITTFTTPDRLIDRLRLIAREIPRKIVIGGIEPGPAM